MITKKKNLHNTIPALAACMAMLTGPLAANGAVEGQWKYIPSFNLTSTIAHGTYPNHTRKLIATPEYIYFLVHTEPYYSGSVATVWNTPYATLLRAPSVREGNPDTPVRIEAVGNLKGVSGNLVSTAEYSPAAGCLMIAYENGAIDLIHDDGRIENILDFKYRNVPGQNVITTIRFSTDGKAAYCGGRFGFAEINMETHRVDNLCLTPVPVSSAFAVGDEIFVGIGGMIYTAPADQAWRSFDNFMPLEIPAERVFYNDSNEANVATYASRCFMEGDLLNEPVYMAPLNDKVVIASMLQPNSGTQTVVALAKDDAGTWNLLRLREVFVPSEAAKTVQYDKLEGYQTPTRDGLTLGSNVFMLSVSSDVMPDFSQENPAKDYRSRATRDIMYDVEKDESGREGNKYQRSATFDNRDVWFYVPFAGWQCRRYDEQTKTWSDMTAISKPEFPEVGLTVNIDYDDQYGLMVRQTGNDVRTNLSTADDVDILHFRRNGVWEDHSLYRHYPEAVKGFSGARGIVVDPYDRKYIYAGSNTSGLGRMNIENPDDHIFFSHTGAKSQQKDLDGFVEAFPQQVNFSRVARVGRPVFDAKGNLLFFYQKYDETRQYLMSWSRAEIDASGGLKDNPASFKGFAESPVQSSGNSFDRLFLFPISDTEGGMIMFDGAEFRTMLFGRYSYDDIHGTLVWEKIGHDVVDQNGAGMEFYEILDVRHDALRNRLWIGHNEGMDWMSIDDLLTGRHIMHRTEVVADQESGAMNRPFLNTRVQSILLDEDNMLWCSVAGNGVFCLNPDQNRIEARYSSSNSLLDSDDIPGMTWDRSTHSLVISTHGGLYEYTPARYADSSAIESLTVWPVAVAPDFTGWVTFSGVPDGMQLSVINEKGVEVARLPEASQGAIQWAVADEDGNRVKGGRYRIVRPGETESLAELTIY